MILTPRNQLHRELERKMSHSELRPSERCFFATAAKGANKNGDQPQLRERTISTGSSQRDENCKGHFHASDHIGPEMPYKFYFKQLFKPTHRL